MILQRAPELKIEIVGSSMTVIVDGTPIDCSVRAFEILNIFREPLSIPQALSQMRVAGMQDWIDLTAEIYRLKDAGALLAPGETRTSGRQGIGFAALPVHVIMLNDRERTDRFIRAIQEAVQTGDVVVEIGTGTGVLSIAAARAGAKQVYALEAADIAATAQRVIDLNGLSDKITILHGWSTQIDLPERADVLISETIGNAIFDENTLPVFRDATARFLKPGARLIPQRIQVYALPLHIPNDSLARHKPLTSAVEQWRAWYGIDFSPLIEDGEQHDIHIMMAPHAARDWQALTDPVLLADIDLATVIDTRIDVEVVTTVTHSGELNALMLYPDLWINPSILLTRHPALVDEQSNWNSMVSVQARSIPVNEGDRIIVRYRDSGGRSTLSAALHPGTLKST